jgi:hypothetical protein
MLHEKELLKEVHSEIYTSRIGSHKVMCVLRELFKIFRNGHKSVLAKKDTSHHKKLEFHWDLCSQPQD